MIISMTALRENRGSSNAIPMPPAESMLVRESKAIAPGQGMEFPRPPSDAAAAAFGEG